MSGGVRFHWVLSMARVAPPNRRVATQHITHAHTNPTHNSLPVHSSKLVDGSGLCRQLKSRLGGPAGEGDDSEAAAAAAAAAGGTESWLLVSCVVMMVMASSIELLLVSCSAARARSASTPIPTIASTADSSIDLDSASSCSMRSVSCGSLLVFCSTRTTSFSGYFWSVNCCSSVMLTQLPSRHLPRRFCFNISWCFSRFLPLSSERFSRIS
mmetsp:Transcript_25198/g.62404  ORF Transcript_25198/g.62404 Transcript_25198/m.62404 type:complete len:212 (+) Transcript_25198:1346-1981(+)